MLLLSYAPFKLRSDKDSHKVWYRKQFEIKRLIGKAFSKAYRSKCKNREKPTPKQTYRNKVSTSEHPPALHLNFA